MDVRPRLDKAATVRHACAGAFSRPAVDWESPRYGDAADLDAEMRRVFEVCASCRICESLCDSFPRLFDLIDTSETGELASVDSASLKTVVDACTLCDICYPVCPYVPPHAYAVDFPNLMVRYRALEYARGNVGLVERELARIDRNGRLLGAVAPIANWASNRDNRICRTMVEKVAGIHRDAAVPKFESRPLSRRKTNGDPVVDRNAPAAGRKVVIYINCFVEYNGPEIGLAARAVLARNGVEATFVYPGCCGMPAMERGDLASVRTQARAAAADLCGWMDEGYDVVTLIPSCSFMVKNTWPLYFPDEPDVTRLSEATFDVCEYLVAVARSCGLAEGLAPLDGGVALHVACHARAQNIGPKAAVMLRMIPDLDVLVMERCSGHGGTWGMMKENFETGMRVGGDVIDQTAESGRRYLASECPLAGEQIVQGLERFPDGSLPSSKSYHPIELLAMSYGVTPAP